MSGSFHVISVAYLVDVEWLRDCFVPVLFLCLQQDKPSGNLQWID